jgi:hypothetical protein
MRLVKVLTLTVFAVALGLASSAAEADDRRFSIGTPKHRTPPPARTPSVIRGGDPKLEHFDRDRGGHRRHGHRHHRPAVVFVAPSRCWQPGFWTYQWVPQAYTYSTWVQGQWSPDGRWIDGHYAPALHHSGYYHPFWVEGYWASC